ncbi:P-loop NTPase fold protein [Vibrio crassostreae]|uniref:P-loop NTPase fold protein n=1 Tax=Vibrio crassostreae TaxID=246167 RepID=UPI000638E690|nr:P-loop NTPase fold protein [Vibrio crassostreae]TCO06297.1 KAP-like P-loop domain-containing protein [Vibrio crassostreae]CAK1732643.1 KAP NTPase domain-containing protein [Vibrio crassostreae]CAK1857332.1 KAP NTPase domain-containing protein [Vibrio crassostreae]CAK1858720.1 KAP NTPase domain-containing protein [Vibrio crassostreae]CAK1894332.1 KAP NTPase domain-containing protein [Vibrio crassostreae]
MSVKLVKKQVHEFLKNKDPEVLVIKGKWGIGKTHSWNSFLNEYKKDSKIRSYSYVSLFGANELNDIKRVIFEHTTDLEILGNSESFTTVKNNYDSISKKLARQSGNVFKEISKPLANLVLKGAGSAIDKAYDALMFASINKQLICFDDIERHSDGVKLKDFLGLVSYLKEQRKCKIVILLNEDAPGIEEYFHYKEKIVDRHIEFAPNSQYCIDIAISGSKYFEQIELYCTRLDIRNIRVLRRIEWHINEVLQHTETYDSTIKEQVIAITIFLCWSYNLHGSDPHNIPNFSYLYRQMIETKETEDQIFELIQTDDSEISETETTRWQNRITSFGLNCSDLLTHVIADSVIKGYVDITKLQSVCSSKQEQIENERKISTYTNVWDIYHGSFNDNLEDVVNAIILSLRKSVTVISPEQYGSLIKLLKDTEHPDLARELTDFYITENKNLPERLNAYDSYNMPDKEFAEQVQAAHDVFKAKEAPEMRLARISESQTYNKADVVELQKLTEDQLFDLFKSFSGDSLTKNIRACLMVADDSERLMRNSKAALMKIGNENPLNKLRLSKFNL